MAAVSGERDAAARLQDAVRAAIAGGTGLRIAGSGSKAQLTEMGAASAADRRSLLLSTAEHSGVLSHRPEELVLTARSGTPLKLLEQTLAHNGQRLPFEPPRFHGGGTLGGAVAAGLSGPGRPWLGAVRDCVLGVELINGLGERLRFGGQVMKNVAGYDLSRLQAGAFGTLGVLLAVSIKLLPAPAVERTLVLELDPAEALAACRRFARSAFPITATCHYQGELRVRLSGAEAAVRWAAQEIGGRVEEAPRFWQSLRDHRHPFFAEASSLWRCSLPPAAQVLPVATQSGEDCLTEWGGALRWWCTRRNPGEVRELVAARGGHALPFDGGFAARQRAGVSPVAARLQSRLREAFDPHGLFNPELGAMDAD
ncbi:MAG: glycolate oxidase subunit GlcE [Pseudomonadales bacterium]